MKNLIKITTGLTLFALIILSSCATHKKNATVCPTFGAQKVQKRQHLSHNRRIFSFKNKPISKTNKNSKPMKQEVKHADTEESYLGSSIVALDETTLISVNQPFNSTDIMKQEKINETAKTADLKTHTKETRITGVSLEKITEADVNPKAKRKTARVIGGSLLLMAVLAGISIPALGTLGASMGLIGVFLLDLLVSFGIYKYHKKEQPKLAKASGLLRLLYSAILGAGITYLFAGSVPMFTKIWGVGLIAFGIHLITLGVLFNNEGGRKWVNVAIKSLLIIAGIGYMVQYTGILLVANPVGFAALMETIFILPMILGEVSYALWMLIKGGKRN